MFCFVLLHDVISSHSENLIIKKSLPWKITRLTMKFYFLNLFMTFLLASIFSSCRISTKNLRIAHAGVNNKLNKNFSNDKLNKNFSNDSSKTAEWGRKLRTAAGSGGGGGRVRGRLHNWFCLPNLVRLDNTRSREINSQCVPSSSLHIFLS